MSVTVRRAGALAQNDEVEPTELAAMARWPSLSLREKVRSREREKKKQAQ